MFRKLVSDLILTSPLTPPEQIADALQRTSPIQLSRWLDEIWWCQGIAADKDWLSILSGVGAITPTPSDPALSIILGTRVPPGLLETVRSGLNPDFAVAGTPQNYLLPPVGIPPIPPMTTTPPPIWRHLIYPYLIESTGLFEILAEVLRRYVVGETLPTPTAGTAIWSRVTEELFFRDPPLFSAGGALTSQLRPIAAVNRRNTYWRMFGLDLPHPVHGIDGQPWKVDVGATINTRFLELWNELLRQVWLGFENDSNSSGAKATDSSYIAYLCQTLSEMMRLRRRGGMLFRDEFAYSTMLDWFHLTVQYDTALVTDLSANAGTGGNPADRLALIGQRVGIAPSRQARELFELADKVSPLMWALELGVFNDPTAAEMLYRHVNLSTNTTIADQMNRIVDLWQSATGERVKDLAVTQRRNPAVPHQAAQPTRLPGMTPPAAVSGATRSAATAVPGPVPIARGAVHHNGHRPAATMN
jgi:hypothetical protein